MVSLLKTNIIKIIKSFSFWGNIGFILFFIGFAPNSFAKSPTTRGVDNTLIAIQVAFAIAITGLLITVVTTFGRSYVKVQNSLIYVNVNLSSKPRYQFYLATVIPVALFSILVFMLSIIFIVILDSVSLIGTRKNVIDWNNIQYGYVFLSLIFSIVLGISLALLAATFVKKENAYTAIIWLYLFLIFFFGGSSVPIFIIRGPTSSDVFRYISFFIPNIYTNFLFINAITDQINFKVYTDILDLVMPLGLALIFFGLKYGITKRK